VVERVLIDLIRREAPRRRLPAAIARLAAIDQEVYAAIVWGGHPVDPDRIAMALRGRLESDPDAAAVRVTIERLTKITQLVPAGSGRPELVSLDNSGEDGEVFAVADPGVDPEEQLIQQEEERTRGTLLAAVKTAAAELPPQERLYLQIVFSATDPLPAREIARTMQLPVEDVYKLKQKSQRWLAEMASRLGKK
jgi:RNA polymerase primary sigma factor